MNEQEVEVEQQISALGHFANEGCPFKKRLRFGMQNAVVAFVQGEYLEMCTLLQHPQNLSIDERVRKIRNDRNKYTDTSTRSSEGG